MNALKPANADTQGKPYLCLDFATRAFNVPNKYEFAWQAWSNARYKHGPTEPLPEVAVPVWFEWTGSVDNMWANWGHVAVWFPGRGVLSSPFSINQKQQWFDTPQKLIAYLGNGSYVGWSEDINDVRVADMEEEPMLNEGDVVNIYQVMDNRDPVADEKKAYVDQPFKKIVYEQLLPKFSALLKDKNNALGIANIRGDRLKIIAQKVQVNNPDNFDTLLSAISPPTDADKKLNQIKEIVKE
jgi:hypothetical protein